MLPNQKSLRYRLEAICTSILAVSPEDFASRFEMLETSVEVVVQDKIDALPDNFGAEPLALSVLATVIGAYWHQDLQEVRSRLLDLQNYSQADISELVLAYAIAYGCRGELQPKSLVQKIYTDLSPRRSLSRNPQGLQNCLEQLQLAQKFVDRGASAISAHSENNGISEAIASSLYYFLSTPHSWQIAIEQANRHNSNNPNHANTAAIRSLIALQTGAIATAYGSEINININTLSHNFRDQAKQKAIWQKGKKIGIYLWSEWSGVYR